MSKTIAIVINTSWNIYNFRLGLLKALQKEGHQIIAIAPRDEYSDKFKKFNIDYHEIKINNKGTNPIEDLKLIYSFYKLYKKINPDVLLHYTIKPNIYGSIAAGILGIPSISNISGLGTVFLNDNISSKIAKILYRYSLCIPIKVFFQNTYDRDLFIKLKLVATEKTDLLPGSGIDTEEFKPVNIVSEKKFQQFLFIARLVKDKGLCEYVNAARVLKPQYPNIEFAILGTYYPGNPTAITAKQMHQWENEGIITYLGTSDNVKLIIAQADSVVLPSYREGLSRVLLEAASMGKPIITTDVPGCREVVNNGENGYLCNAKDVHSLIQQMEKMLLQTYTQRTKMGEMGRKKIMTEFDEKFVINKYLNAIT